MKKTKNCFGCVKNGFSQKDVAVTSSLPAKYLKNALLSSASKHVFTDPLARSYREVWPIITLIGTIVGSAGLNAD